MENLGCIELHPWNSRLPELDHPDFLVIDLDPEGRPFSDVAAVALVTRRLLQAIEAPAWVKTSGQTGLHINIPLGRRYTYEQARQFARLVTGLVNKEMPELTSLERSPKNRQGKIYLDYLQNRRGQTMAAPYSLRPQRGAPVSTPLRWEEVTDKLSPADFHLKNLPARLEKVGDLWQDVLGEGIDMARSLAALKKLWAEES
jgi:bifunctional non-homologous end joining protein LigD